MNEDDAEGVHPDGQLGRRGFLGGTAGVALGALTPTTAAGGELDREERESEIVFSTDAMRVVISRNPFGVAFSQPETDAGAPTGFGYHAADGLQLSDLNLDLDTNKPTEWTDPIRRYGTVGFAVGASQQFNTPLEAWGVAASADLTWHHATHITADKGTTFELATTDPARTVDLVVYARGDAIGIQVSIENPGGVVKTGWSFHRPDDERFLGFGERSDGVDQTGNIVENWAEEGPYSTGALQSVTDPIAGERWQGPPPVPGTNYPIPWCLSSRGYGFLLESTAYNLFRLAHERDDAWHVETWEPGLDFVVYPGPTPAEALARFSESIGRQPEPAEWFFGPWYQAAGDHEFREALSARWREWDIPMTVRETSIHYLPAADHKQGDDFHPERGTPEFHTQRTASHHEQGYRLTAYVNSFVSENHPDGAFEEGDDAGYFLQTPTGDTYPVPYFAYFDENHRYHGVVDFTNPEAERWWQELVTEPIDHGYDGWMEDFGEYVPPNSRTASGDTGFEHHNRYPTLYHRATHRLTTGQAAGLSEYDQGRSFAQFVRAGYTRTAQYARIVWGGDPNQDYSAADGLAAAVSQGQSMGLSGVAYWRTDIGGFVGVFNEEKTDAELFIRWAQYGAFNGLMSPRARGYPRPLDESERAQPWHQDVRPIWRKFCKLRTQLFPYIWDTALEYQATGLPIIRHLALHYPDDSEVYSDAAEYEFLFGRDLLVAPVITEGARERRLYLPEGSWVNFWDAVTYEEDSGAYTPQPPMEITPGGQYVTVDAPLDEIPIFVRAGTQLELLPPDVDTLANPSTVTDDIVTLADISDYRRLTFPPAGPTTR